MPEYNLNEVLEQSAYNFVLYGRSGAGKTFTASTIGSEQLIYIGSEKGGIDTLTSLHKEGVYDLSGASIFLPSSMEEAERDLEEAMQIKKIVLFIDSLSVIGEQCLRDELVLTPDGRQAYPSACRRMTAFLELACSRPGLNIFTAWEARLSKGDYNTEGYSVLPAMPVTDKYQQSLSYRFSNILNLYEQTTEGGEKRKCFLTATDFGLLAKTRSSFDRFEKPCWKSIYSKLI